MAHGCVAAWGVLRRRAVLTREDCAHAWVSETRAECKGAARMCLCALTRQRARPVTSMLIAPGPAQRCIESFNGRILFMPSNYSRDASTFPAAGLRSRWEPSLTLMTYYLLVLASLTGLSTLLGQTDVLGAAAQRRRAVRGAVLPPAPFLPPLPAATPVCPFFPSSCVSYLCQHVIIRTPARCPRPTRRREWRRGTAARALVRGDAGVASGRNRPRLPDRVGTKQRRHSAKGVGAPKKTFRVPL